MAEVYAFDGQAGVIVHEDFGNTILRDVLVGSDEKTREDYLTQAIALIAGVQAATPRAYEMNSIASRLAFDFEKLSWEFDFFTTHYFETLRHTPLNEAESAGLKLELADVARELAEMPRNDHRDFHAANLMLDRAMP